MAITLSQTYTAVAANITSSFHASGGTAPYVYSVQAGGAGGSINSSTGIYIAPVLASSSPNFAYDTIIATDAHSNVGSAQILVGTPLILLCDILQNQLGLDNNHLFLWDQKVFQPTDSNLYLAVGVQNSKPFGNTNYFDGTNQTAVQSINMLDTITIDAISRGPAARDQRANILMALNSNYAEQQQEANSFNIGKLPAGGQFINLSEIDGAAIPYRFRISLLLQYFVTLTPTVPYLSGFSPVEITTEA